MKYWSATGTCLLAIGALAGVAAAGAAPSKADMDFCNQKAAQAALPGPVQPGSSPRSAPPATGMQTEGEKPGTPVSPGTADQSTPGTPRPGNNPTGGRITDSSVPGTPPSATGMAPIGESDPSYRQAYV